MAPNLRKDTSYLKNKNYECSDVVEQIGCWKSYFFREKIFFAGRGWSKELLAREVLAEIPDQLLSYMKSKGFQPPKAAAAAAAAPQLPAATWQPPQQLPAVADWPQLPAVAEWQQPTEVADWTQLPTVKTDRLQLVSVAGWQQLSAITDWQQLPAVKIDWAQLPAVTDW